VGLSLKSWVAIEFNKRKYFFNIVAKFVFVPYRLTKLNNLESDLWFFAIRDSLTNNLG
jgi:hypothetical protein